jgi:hypothetical protein
MDDPTTYQLRSIVVFQSPNIKAILYHRVANYPSHRDAVGELRTSDNNLGDGRSARNFHFNLHSNKVLQR